MTKAELEAKITDAMRHLMQANTQFAPLHVALVNGGMDAPEAREVASVAQQHIDAAMKALTMDES